MITCSRCPAEWTGKSRAHCSGCHVTFGGVTAFDTHRKGYKCHKPESIGLHDNGKGVWISDYTGPEDSDD